MHFFRLLLDLLHLIGFASMLGGFLVQLTAAAKRVVPSMLHGVGLQLVTGFALVFVVAADGDTVNHAKVGVKLLVLVAIFLLMFRSRHKESIDSRTFYLIGGLTLLNAAIAKLV